MKEKKQLKISLNTAMLLVSIFILMIIGIIFLGYQNKLIKNNNNVLNKYTNNINMGNENEILNTENSDINKSTNTVEEKNNTENQNKIQKNTTNNSNKDDKVNAESARDKAIKSIKKCLSDKTWIKNNLSLSNYLSAKKDSNDEEYKFEVLNAKSDNPVVIVRVESERNLALMAFSVQYKNDKVSVDSFTDEPVHNSHSNYEVNDEYVVEMYGHMGSWKYSIYDVKDADKRIVKTDEGYKEEGDYTELNDLEKQYKLRLISYNLTNANIDKYLK